MDSGASTTVAIGTLLSRRKERGSNDDPLLSLTQDKGVIPQDEAGRRNISGANKTTYWRVYPDDIVYNTMRMWQGASARSDYFGIVSPAYTVCCPAPGSSARFLSYSLKLPEHIRIFRGRSQGLTSDVWNLHFDEFARIRLKFVPGYVEQERIAAILSSVDNAIEKTQAVIDQVQVVKRGVTQELLERGLPGRHPRFKQTEIGEIPEEWRLSKLSDIASLQTGIAKNKAKAGPLSVPYLRVANVQDGFLNLAEIKALEVDGDAVARYALRAGDVLLTEGGDADKLGRGAVWNAEIEPCLHQNHIFVARPYECIRPLFLSLYAGSSRGKSYFLNCSKQTTNLASMNSTQLKGLPVPIPLLDEQDAILERTGAVDDRLKREEDSVGHLRELKSALMSVLLTGELRVSPEPE